MFGPLHDNETPLVTATTEQELSLGVLTPGYQITFLVDSEICPAKLSVTVTEADLVPGSILAFYGRDPRGQEVYVVHASWVLASPGVYILTLTPETCFDLELQALESAILP